MPNIHQLLNFVQVNRGETKAFRNYNTGEIVFELNKCLNDNLLLYAMDGDEIVGVATGYPIKNFGDTICVHNILATRQWVLKEFLRRFMEMGRSRYVLVFRHNEFKLLNLKKLYNRFFKQPK